MFVARLLCPRNFPGKNIGAGCHFLFHGIFPTQESNLLHYRQIFLLIELSGWPIASQIHRFHIIRSWESQSKISVSKFPDFQTLTTNSVFKKYCPGQRKNSLPIMLHKITWSAFLSLPTSSSLFSSLHCPNLMIRINY